MIGTVLLIAGLLLFLAGGVWLLYLAYQDGIALFLATLLVPFFGLYTWLRTWPQSKAAIVLQLAGALAITAGLQLAPTALLGGPEEQPEVSWSEKRNVRSGPVFGESGFGDGGFGDSGGVDPQRSSTLPNLPSAPDADPDEAEESSETAQTPTPALRPNERRVEVVPPERIDDYLDRFVTVELHDGERFQGTIERLRPDAVFLRRRIGGGTISFRVERSEIREIRVTSRR
jgi:hypothetical protein